jgi:hypothetical protein
VLCGAVLWCGVQVYAANDVVYGDISAGFSQLCSSLLPSLELQLVRLGSLAHEGLQFRSAPIAMTVAGLAEKHKQVCSGIFCSAAGYIA